MDRKKFVIGFSAVIVIAALVFVYMISRNTESTSGSSLLSENTTSATDMNKLDVTKNEASVKATETDAALNTPEPTVTPEPTPVEPLKSEDIEVGKNSAEFDLKAVLYEDANKATYLKLEYYLDGETVIKEFTETNLPEIKEMFEKRDSNSPKEDGFRIGQMLLNAKYSKVYFTVIKASSAFCDTAVYSINLKDASIKKLGNLYGRVGNMLFNSNCKYLAFSFLNSPLDSNHIEKEMLDIITCEKDAFAVRYSRDLKKVNIGTNSNPKTLYNYELKSWKTDTVLLLKQTAISIDGSFIKDAKPVEVLYNVTKNLLLNSDGTAIQQVDAKSTPKAISNTTAAAVTLENESLKTMKSFYSYLASTNDYAKAMELLDEGFYLEMDLLKQFGVDKVQKKDIDADSASMYSEILRAAKLDMIVKINETKNTSEIYYYQTLSLNEESQVKQALVMQLKKTTSGWKIVLIKEADVTKEPFTD